MASITSSGLGSNLDVNGIVDQLMAIEKKALTKLDNEEAGYQVKISAFGTLKASLASVQTAVKKLSDPAKFSTARASVGNSELFTASVFGKNVAAGNYSVEVQNLAQAQKLKSTGSASSASVIGTGKLTIQLGTYDATGNTFTPNSGRPEKVITVDAQHNTLAGIRDAINDAGGDVTASIVNDGGTTGTRLVLSSKYSGTESSIRVTVDDDDLGDADASGLSQLAFDPTKTSGTGKNLLQTVEAKDALVVIDGITVTKQTNSITDAIEGVTLNLLKAGTATTLDVSKDATAAKTAITEFVTTYNEFATSMNTVTGYDPETKAAGLLLGDAGARGIGAQVRSVLTSASAGSMGAFKRLAEVGVTFDKSGLLAVNTAKLDKAITTDTASVSGLFALQGVSTDPFVSYVSSTAKTAAGAYDVNITQLATHGAAVGQQAAALTITAGVNDTLAFSVNGKAGSITLSAKTYASASELAAEIQTKMNASAVKTYGLTVSVAESAGKLSFTSDTWGSTSIVRLSGGTALTDLVGTTVDTDGVNVAGTISGVAATGSGQKLTGASGSAVDGLKLEVSGTALGSRGVLTFSRGISDRLDKIISRLNGTGGIAETKTDSYNATIKRIGERRDAMTAKLVKIEARYRAQFNALDKIVSQFNQSSSVLSQQVAQWNKSSA